MVLTLTVYLFDEAWGGGCCKFWGGGVLKSRPTQAVPQPDHRPSGKQ